MRFRLLALLAAILLAAFLLTRGGAEPAAEDAAPPAGASVPASSASPAPPSPPAPAEELDRAPAAPAASDPAPPPAEAMQEILVLGPDGAPVPGIGYEVSWSLQRIRRMASLATTDAQGIGRVEAPPADDLRPRFAVLAFHGAEAVGARLPDEGGIASPTVITLPPWGSIRVEAAAELASYSSAWLQLDEGEHAGRGLPLDAVDLADGAAQFPYVGLDQRWIVRLNPRTGLHGLQRRVAGPATAGEEVLVRFEAGQDCVLTGILAGADGVPLAGVEVSAMLRCERLSSGSNLRTDPDGRFTVPVSEQVQGAGPLQLEFRRYLPRTEAGFGSHEPDPSQTARAPLPKPLPLAEVDLGVVPFVLEPVLAAGTVRERGGGPIAGANLFVEELVFADAQGEEHWNHLNELLRARSATDGSFTIHGAKPERALRLRTHHQDFLKAPPRPLAYAEAGLEILLERAGGFDGLAHWEHADALLKVQLRLEGTAGEFGGGGSIEGSEFRLRIRGVPPGNYDLVGRLERTNEEFLRLAGIEIRSGAIATDPRVQPLELGGFLDVLSVAPRDPLGRLPEQCMVLRLRENGGGGSSVSSPDGIQQLPLLPGATANLLIEAPGFRLLHLPNASGAIEPRLEPAFEVTILLRGDEPLANEHGAYGLRAEPTREAGSPVLMASRARRDFRPRADRTGRFEAIVLGAWLISLTVPERHPNGDVHPRAVPLGTITIGAGDAGRVYALDLPALGG